MVILIRLLLVPVVIVFALPLAVIGAFVALAVTGHALDLSALIVLLMLRCIVVTNAIVLRDLTVGANAIVLRDPVQHKTEAGADVRTALVQSGRTHVRSILMTAAATILALIPPPLLSACGLIAIAASLATVVTGGLLGSMLLTLVVIPVIYSLLVGLH
jgi:HAE1 family hydrophobic/amphiphilic exporter-1